MATTNTAGIEFATFGAGCFWGTEKYFRNQFGDNLMSAVVGYLSDISTTGCDEICAGTTNHVEVLQISFERQSMAYCDFVRFFFHMHDPMMMNRLSNDRATQYRSVIFTDTKEQQQIAEQVRAEVQTSGKIKGKIVTQTQPVNELQFHIAEQKHKNYLENKYRWL